MKKVLTAAAAAAFLMGTGLAMADSTGGNGPTGTTGKNGTAASQPAPAMAAPATTGAAPGMPNEDKDAKKGNVSAKDKVNTDATQKVK